MKKGVDGIIILYDVTERDSFTNVNYWMEMIKNSSKKTVPIILVGAKNDKPNRTVAKEEGEKLAKELGLTFYECSAKNEKVAHIFEELVKHIEDKQKA